ncbi:LysE/ArgO family amino acid transporter [Clavibacter michiganensis]|uniref:LysE/ArgO family amino acid transporter n=1 Tax=Clavibacter michiganensis TaxID=28447 RepID=UPI0009A8662E|nr:LysE/ArgO family amino acid transporter [Clavibacter michiganensis]MBF4638644.1 amino acid transporter [Clavibacter michiganensis subsp. michiganensis]MDO4125108.1 LysE/ArgO family amino acid transporter [Clavibacter michiganensis]OQJ65982.1 lysine transporter LysE [Clavibacter michiganensis subsp. michiganensis]QGV75878.1 amino acid transporter [Clavibacter michiganensis subsp. michiganensis]RMC86516.1 amino acid transporter [Clavibacter michiganensis subsp. michiganensis]
MHPLAHALSGFGLGFSLIAAIGAQNAFILRQGTRREHVLVVVLICAVSDVILIGLGVAGIGAVIEAAPVAIVVIRILGACFLAGYAALSLLRAVAPRGLAVAVSAPRALGTVVAACLALTWLNPHVYLDTVLLVGSVAAGHGDGRWAFGVGAMVASCVWFTLLATAARVFAPVLARPSARPSAWRVLDTVIAGVMLVLAVQILLPLVPEGPGEGARIAVATAICAALAGAVAAWSVARRRRADAALGDATTDTAPAADGLGTPEASALLR